MTHIYTTALSLWTTSTRMNIRNKVSFKSDKCNKIVIMYNTEYHNKMQSVLNNTDIYKKDLTLKIQGSLNNLVTRWFNNVK